MLKFTLKCLAFLIGLLISGFLFIHYNEHFNDLDNKSMKRMVRDYAGYELPEKAEVIYKVNYWAPSFQTNHGKPRSLCYVLKLADKDIENLKAKKFKESSDNDGCWGIPNPVESYRGCSKYGDYSASSFVKIADFCRGPTGARIFLNKTDNIVMFEPYLLD